MLQGEFVYDDGATIYRNPNTLGITPWIELWRRDYWGGDQLTDPKSHKSFRPITTATLRLNYAWANAVTPGIPPGGHALANAVTWPFHVVNVALHAAVALLCLPTAHYALGCAGARRPGSGRKGGAEEGNGREAAAAAAAAAAASAAPARFAAPSAVALVSALLFAVHPVHSEAVQNITGRAEPLMSLFFLSGFLVYASTVYRHRASDAVAPTAAHAAALAGAVVLMCCSLLSKEMGATLTMLCSFWDFFVAQELSLRHLVVVPLLPGPCGPAAAAEPAGSAAAGPAAAPVASAEEAEAEAARKKPASSSEGSAMDGRCSGAAPDQQPMIHDGAGNIATTTTTTTSDGAATAAGRRPTVRRRLLAWAVRTALLAAPTLAVVVWRQRLNGGNPPFLRYNVNRHALEPNLGAVPPHLVVGPDTGVHGWPRRLSLAWLWLRYWFHACVLPRRLCPDWSGPALPLLRATSPFADYRVAVLAAAGAAWVGAAWFCGTRRTTHPGAMACLGFYALPFLPASNIFFPVGTTVAERVVYLPSLGVCMAFALLLTPNPGGGGSGGGGWVDTEDDDEDDEEEDGGESEHGGGDGETLDCGPASVADKVPSQSEVAAAIVAAQPASLERLPSLLPPPRTDALSSGPTGDGIGEAGAVTALSKAATRAPPPIELPKDGGGRRDGGGGGGERGGALRRWWRRRRGAAALRWGALLVLGGGWAAKCVERNLAWSDGLALWSAAYEVNPASSHVVQQYAVHAMGSDPAGAAKALDSVRAFAEVDRVDADEIYSTLAICLRQLGRLGAALEVLAEGWARMDAREAALARGVVVWHMHELTPRVEKVALRRARLLAGQAHALATLDLREACAAMALALEFAPNDGVVQDLARALEAYAEGGYRRPVDAAGGEGAGGAGEGRTKSAKPHQTRVYEAYMAKIGHAVSPG